MVPEEWDCENRALIWKSLNHLLEFQDKSLRHEYTEFCKHRMFFLSIGILFCIGFLWVIPTSLAALHYSDTSSDKFFCIVNLAIGCAISISGFILCLIHKSSYFSPRLQQYSRLCQAIISFSCGMLVVWSGARSIFMDSCPSVPFPAGILAGFHCDFNEGYGLYVVLTLVGPLPVMHLLIFNEAQITFTLLLMSSQNFAFACVAVYLHESRIIFVIVAWTIVMGYVSIELHLFRVGNFLALKKLQETVAENRRMHEENRAMELRHMIGNLAHDLKTVRSFYAYSSDFI